MKLFSCVPILGLIWAASGLSAYSHPGHAWGEHGALHLVTSPYHLALLAAAGAGLWALSHKVESRLSRRFLRILSVAVCGAAVLAWGLRA